MSMPQTVSEWFAVVSEKAAYEEYLLNRQTDWQARFAYADWLDRHHMKKRADIQRMAALLQQELPPSYQGDFFAETFRKHPNGDREPIWTAAGHNLTTTVGRNYALSAAFAGGSQSTNWYFLPITGPTATVSTGDTYTSHSGWTENTAYDEAARQVWDKTIVSNVATNVSSPAVLTMNATASIYGSALANSSTKGDSGAGPVLWCAGEFVGGRRGVFNDMELKMYYALTSA